MKIAVLTLSLLATHTILSASVPASASDLDPAWLGQVMASTRPSAFVANVQANGLKEATRNPDILQLQKTRPGYTHEIPTGAIVDQGSTGNCWIEGGLNVLRSRLYVGRGLDTSFNFSTNYVFFYSLVEKANVFLDGVVQNKMARPSAKDPGVSSRPNALFQDGGFWETFTYLVGKYGLVPSAAMPPTEALGDDSTLLQELDNVLAVAAGQIIGAQTTSREALEILKLRGIATVLRVLQTHLGTPPQSFVYAGVNYSPLSFNQNFVKLDLSEYAHVGAYPNLATNQHYIFRKTEVSPTASGQHLSDVDFINVTSVRMAELVRASIMKDQPVWTQIDSQIDLDLSTGILHPQIYRRSEAYDLPQARFMPNSVTGLNLRSMGSNHAPVIVGVDVDAATGKLIKFKIENSWGVSLGDNGFLHMYNEWFQLHDYEVVVLKSFLTEDERGLLSQKPQVTDPLYNFTPFVFMNTKL